MSEQEPSDDIYLDHAATTPCDPRVFNAMRPYFSERFGNPSSIYRLGQEARAAIDTARAQASRVLGCDPAEIIWTSGATEADNLAIKGVLAAAMTRFAHPHLITIGIEHHAVLHAAEHMRLLGAEVTLVPVGPDGIVRVADIIAAVRPETVMVSVMLANNECGAIQPVAEIARAMRNRGVLVHTDAVQATGSLPINVNDLGVDLLVASAHKCYGPKGAGLLYARSGIAMDVVMDGGGQESGRRGGTENVPGIVGCGMAIEQAELLRERYVRHCSEMRDALLSEILTRLPDVELNGPPLGPLRLPNNLNISIPGVQGETIVLAMDLEGVAISAGSACTTGRTEPSHVLLAMGMSDERARSSIRMTVGRGTTRPMVTAVAERLARCVVRVRELGG